MSPRQVKKGKGTRVIMSDEDSAEEKIQSIEKPKRRQTRKAKAKKEEDGDDLKDFIVDEEVEEPPKKKRGSSKTTSRRKKTLTSDSATQKPQKVEKRKVSGGYRPKWLGPERDPPQHGSKPIPEGKPQCLEGIIFVLTGLNESLTREEMSELISRYGGIERSAVSGKTKYLIAGFEMEDGRPITEGSKYKAAVAKGVKIIDEDDLLKMIRDSNPEGASKYENAKQEKEQNELLTELELMKDHATVTSSLLTVKYAPHNLKEIIGNPKIIENLQLWLKEWDDVHIHQTTVIQWNRQNPGARAALLSGPPGIGKTTTAHLIARDQGREVIELNASDKRSMSKIREALRDSVLTQSIGEKKKVIIMDEVDGMSAGDRGGVQELIRIIKTTQTPIICICNDRESPKVRSLANSCYDLTFTKPTQSALIHRLQYICQQESIPLTADQLTLLVEATDGDIRQSLNKLQLLSTSSKGAIESLLSSFSIDMFLSQTGFQIAKQFLVGTTKYSFSDRYAMFFSDYEMTPLIVEQNYLDSIQSRHYSEDKVMEAIVSAADGICDLEYFQSTMRRENRWSLLPTVACMTIRAARYASGSFVFTKFPQFYGKNSRITKAKRLMVEMINHISSHTSISRSTAALEYSEVLNQYILCPLVDGDSEKCIDRLDEYGLTREDMTDCLNGYPWEGTKSQFEEIDSKIRSSFTRKYNNREHLLANTFASDDSLVSQGKRRSVKRGARKGGSSSSKRGVSEQTMEEEISEKDDDDTLFVI